DRALAAWPWSRETHRLAARAARLAGDLPAAEAHLNRAIGLAGGADDAVQLEFLLLRAQTGDLDGVAQSLFTLAEAGHPESPLILETLTRAYLLGQRYKLAYACASRWLELHPDAPKAYLLRGFALERLDNHKGAAQDYHRALAADPDHLIARLRVAEMLLEDKQAPEAEPHLERLLRQAPDHPQVRGRLGICRFLQGRPDEARRLMEDALPHLPRDATLLVTLAQLDIQEGRGADAEARLRAVLAADPADTEARFHLAAALRLQGKADAAAAELAAFERHRALADRAYKLLQDVPDKPAATAAEFSELGTVLLGQGKDRHGLSWLDKALEKDPNHPPTLRALAAYYEGKGNAKRAAGYRARLPSP
ncbi:MAG: tetratricopeptide repeat protein, partial [Gemmataceae bacterium]|nr:tetratricopeptide repeat protein [Gemmataceae bacterium]